MFSVDEGDEEGKYQDDGDDHSDDSEDDEWESEDGDNEGNMDDDDGFEGMDEQADGSGDAVWTKKASQSPFAPAEMYLSDMIGSGRSGALNDDQNPDNYLLLNVSSSLVFSPTKADPLAATDLQGAVIDLLKGLKGGDRKGTIH